MSFPMAGDSKAQEADTEQVRAILDEGVPAGLRIALTGSAGANRDVFDAFEGHGHHAAAGHRRRRRVLLC